MKKFKLVVSDLHLGVGKILEGGKVNSLEEYYYDDKFSEFLNYYTTGEYSDAEVELVLNGDIFNFLQVDYRGHFLTVLTEQISLEKLQRIVAGHPKFFAAIRKFAGENKRIVTYVIGNHDQDMMWPATQSYLNEVLSTQVRFKNIVYFFDGVHIEHGHMYEAANRIDPKKFFLKKDLPERILNLPFGSHFFVDFVLKVKLENPFVDKVRPFRAWVRWSLFQHTLFTLRTMTQLFSFFARAALGIDARRHWPWRRLLHILLEGAIFPDLGSAAKKILEDPRVHTVIFGHSHVYQYRQWAGKEYFNTGTWTELTSLDITSLGKITKLTYVLIEYPTQVPEAVAETGETPEVKSERLLARPRGRLKEWRGYHRIEEDVDVS